VKIDFEKQNHEELANNSVKRDKWAAKKKPPVTGDEILQAVNALEAAPTLADMPSRPWHPHPLFGNYKGHFAIWINKQWRTVFRPNPGNDQDYRIDNPKTIKAVTIVEICQNYHKK